MSLTSGTQSHVGSFKGTGRMLMSLYVYQDTIRRAPEPLLNSSERGLKKAECCLSNRTQTR